LRVTINVLVLNPEKIVKCNCLKVKGESLTTGRNRTIKLVIRKASNVNIVSSSGDPGAGSYVQIRGQNTITEILNPCM
jgi:hypothetical protein